MCPTMSEKMLKFVEIGQQNPPKRGEFERKEDFNEIYEEFINEKLENNLVDVPNVESRFVKFIAH